MFTPFDLLRMTDGLIVHHCLCAAAKLGIADVLKDGARSTENLADVLKVNEDALYRTLRFLAGQACFTRPPLASSQTAFCRNGCAQTFRSPSVRY